MINITDKHNCCGCEACVQVCPKQCISFQQDEEGFFYPLADKNTCVECGLCEKTCPELNQNNSEQHPLRINASKSNSDAVRLSSSSGGVFSEIAQFVIGQNGIVFGASFDDDWNVVHFSGDTEEGITQFRCSKYVQSRIGEAYKEVKTLLKDSRQVLFSGTPCQIAGLRNYLNKDYPNLLCIEVICHGVPSPKVWQNYLALLKKENKIGEDIHRITFRDKAHSWQRYNFTVESDKGKFSESVLNNVYLKLFVSGLNLRPSCYSCPFKAGRSGADITLADFWGFEKYSPEQNDDRGMSLVVQHTEKGKTLFSLLFEYAMEVGEEDAFRFNTSYYHPFKEPKDRPSFWSSYKIDGIGAYYTVMDSRRPSPMRRLLSKIKRMILK